MHVLGYRFNCIPSSVWAPHWYVHGTASRCSASLEHKLKLLHNSWKLKDNAQYGNVFIRSSKSHTERIAELNSWMIVEDNGWQNRFKMASNGRLKRNRDRNYRQPQQMRPEMNGPGYFLLQAHLLAPRPLWWSPSWPFNGSTQQV